MHVLPMQAADAAADGWNFEFSIEWANPIFYLNAGGLVLAVLLMVALNSRRGTSGLADGAWWASLVVVVGTGLHFVGDLTNFPEAWDHVLIHAVLFTALLVFWLAARHED